MSMTAVVPGTVTTDPRDPDRVLALATVLRWSAQRVGWPLGCGRSLRYQLRKLLHRREVGALRERCAEVFRLTTMLLNDPTRADIEERVLQLAYVQAPAIGHEADRMLGRAASTVGVARSSVPTG